MTVLTELTNKGAASSWTRDSLRRAVVSTHDRAVVRTPDRAVVSNLNRACRDRDRESKPRPKSPSRDPRVSLSFNWNLIA